MTPARIAVLGLGEAGGEIARDLVAAGADVRGFDPRVEPPPGVAPRVDDADAVRDADLVLSVNSAHDATAALDNVTAGSRPGTIWADLNTAAPGLKPRWPRRPPAATSPSSTSHSWLRYPAWACVRRCSPPAPARRGTPRSSGLRRDATVRHGPAGAASSRKLLRSVFYKGLAAAVSRRWRRPTRPAARTGCATTSPPNWPASTSAHVDRLVDGTHRHARAARRDGRRGRAATRPGRAAAHHRRRARTASPGCGRVRSMRPGRPRLTPPPSA